MEDVSAQQTTVMRHKNKDLRIDRNEAIRKEFVKLKKEGYRLEVIYCRLSDKYYLAIGTIEAIVLELGRYKSYAVNERTAATVC